MKAKKIRILQKLHPVQSILEKAKYQQATENSEMNNKLGRVFSPVSA